MCCVLRSSIACALPSALYLSCFASPALSVDTGFFITSSLALHLSRFILCAVSFDALSLHFAFRALPPLRYRSTPDSSSLRLLHFTFRASFLCAVSFGALSLTLRLSASRFPCCTAPWRLTEAPLPQRRCFLSAFSGFFPDKLCQLLLSCFDSVPRAFDSPPGCARPSSGQAPLSL